MASIHIEPNMKVHRAALTIQSAWRSWVAPGLPTTLAEWHEQPDWKYYNPIIDVVSHLTDKVGPDITREIAMFSSESVDRNEAAKDIQWWWRGLQWCDDDDDEEWRHRCVGPYSDDLSRCFGLCCN